MKLARVAVGVFLSVFSPACSSHNLMRIEANSKGVDNAAAADPALKPKMQPVTQDETVTVANMMHSASTDADSALAATAAWRACAGAAILTVAIVVFLYWRQGLSTICMVITYLLALSTMKAVVKVVEVTYSFKFPLFLTATHFIAGALVAFSILFYKSTSTGGETTKPSLRVIGNTFVPIAVTFAAAIAMGNIALMHSTTAFVEIVGASGPIFTVLIMFCMSKPVDVKLLGPCFLVFVGCAMTSNGEPRFSWLGFILATGANVPRALRSILQQVLLQNDTACYSPLAVLAWTCLPSSIVMLIWSLFEEGLAPYRQWYAQGLLSQLTVTLLVSCVNACILNLAVLYVIKDLGAIGTQIVAQAKSILVVLGGMCFLEEKVSRMEFVGFFIVLVGVYAYNDVDARLKSKSKKEQAEKATLAGEKTALAKDIK